MNDSDEDVKETNEDVKDEEENDEKQSPRHLHLHNSSRSSWVRAPEMLEGFASFIL